MWGFDEDLSMKQKLSGFSVANHDGTVLPIAVFFRLADTEIRSRTFPLITIDLIDIEFDRSRAHRAPQSVLPFDLEQATPPTGFSLVADDQPLPWVMHYQLSACARDPRHDRQMQFMMFQMFPEMFGNLVVPMDGTIRRADLLNAARRDLPADRDGKRIYRYNYEIGVSSEFYLNQVLYVQNALSVNVTLDAYVNVGLPV